MELSAADGRKRARPEDQGEEHGEAKRLALVPWPPHQQNPSSRIYRVSRGSGGKDRHSKVYTAKGIRDRRVRLSVATAIQFYDLQDRLGYDQPSKAVEWLIKAAAAAIDKLPSLDATAFPNHPASANNKQPAAADPDADGSQLQQQQQLTRSGCSSTSETSKGSVLSLSRSDSRVKARERARDRSASVKDKDDSVGRRAPASAQAASFTELLTGLAVASAAAATPPVAVAADHKQNHTPWQQMTASATADYLGFTQPRKSVHSFASPAPHLANIAPVAMAPAQHFSLTPGGEPQAEMTHFSFLQDHFMPVHPAPASAPALDYNLNFSMSSGLVGVNTRGTLQSNSQPHLSSHHHHHQQQQQQQQLQRLSAPLDAPHIPFLFSPAVAVASPGESHFAAAAALQLWDGFRHSDIKEKGKN
jgi:hypothetical protein